MLFKLYCLVLGVSYAVATNLERSVNTVGGYGVTTFDQCPAGTSGCDDNTCCPTSLDCFQDDAVTPGYIGCCAGGNDCLPALELSPHCADNTWNLWNITSDGAGGAILCCLPGTTGGQDGNCYSSGTALPAGVSKAVLVSQSESTATSISETTQAPSTTSHASTTPASSASTTSSATTQASVSTTASAATTSKTSGGNMNSGIHAAGFGIAGLLAVAIP